MSSQTKPNHTDRGHAEFSPSALKYLAACPGFHGREGTSSAAERGTRIHEALEVRNPAHLQDEAEVQCYEQCVALEDSFIASYEASFAAATPDQIHPSA